MVVAKFVSVLDWKVKMMAWPEVAVSSSTSATLKNCINNGVIAHVRCGDEDGDELEFGKDTEEFQFPLQQFPSELVRHQIAQFLEGRDLVRLSMCSRGAHMMVPGWTHLWRSHIMSFELGPEAEIVLRGEHAMAWPEIYARLWCHKNKLCVYCAQPCERPELPTTVTKAHRPLCMWARRLQC